MRAREALREPQHVDRAVYAGFCRLHGIVLIVNRRGRASEIVDLIDLDVQRKGHVVTHQLEARMSQADGLMLLLEFP